MNFFGTKEIKTHVINWIEDNGSYLAGKTVVDLPAGNGVSSEALKIVGANVKPFDLISELFQVKGLTCEFADLSKKLPLENNSVDYVLCQEGIEHVADQGHAFREFSRVLKTSGRLVITTPNYSNIKSKLSYLFCESEYFGKIMPPNEVDSLWLSSKNKDSIYYGHVFLVGFFKLRLWAQLSGLRLVDFHSTRVNTTSLIFFPLIYPFIFWYSWKTYRRAMRNSKYESLWKELFKWSISPKILLENHLFLEFEKTESPEERISKLHLNTQAQEFIT